MAVLMALLLLSLERALWAERGWAERGCGCVEASRR